MLNRVRADQGRNPAGSGGSSNPADTKEGAGRKELADDQKSEKTIKNRESMS